MQPKAIKQLIQYFQRLPGVGPRQAARFAYALLDESSEALHGLRGAIKALAEETSRCPACFRARENSPPRLADGQACPSCGDPTRANRILVVEKDQDVETVEKSGLWRGGYHVAGGLISPLRENPDLALRLRGLHTRVASLASAHKEVEVVMGFAATPNGEETQRYLEKILEPFVAPQGPVTITSLARGLSTGAEIEYADPSTLSYALKNRK